MNRLNPDRAKDERDLEMLHLLDVARKGPDFVGARFGVTRGQIAGLRNRTTGSKARTEHRCLCEKPENKDGGMPARWWAA